MTWLAWADRVLVLTAIFVNLESLRRLHRKVDGRGGEPGRETDHQP